MRDGRVELLRARLAFLLVLVLLIVAVLLVSNHELSQRRQDRLNLASTPPPITTPAVPGRRSSVVEASIDDGALSRAQGLAAARKCLRETGRTTRPAVMHFARRTAMHRVVIFTGQDNIAYACAGIDMKIYDGPNPPYIDDQPRHEPADRLYGVSITANTTNAGHVTAMTTAAYRTDPEVATVQLRLTRGNQTGPWYPAALHNGYAFAEARLEFEVEPRVQVPFDLDVEDRALGYDGQQLPILRIRN